MAPKSARGHLTISATGTSPSMVKISQERIRRPRSRFPSRASTGDLVRRAVRSGDRDAAHAEADRLREVRASLLSGLLDRTITIKSAELEV